MSTKKTKPARRKPAPSREPFGFMQAMPELYGKPKKPVVKAVKAWAMLLDGRLHKDRIHSTWKSADQMAEDMSWDAADKAQSCSIIRVLITPIAKRRTL